MLPDMSAMLLELTRRPVPPDPAPDAMAPPSAARAASADTAELITHILERYHEVHRREFPEAIRLARKVEAVHAEDPRAPAGLGDHLAVMADELESHQMKEEQVLFPLMLSGGGAMARFPIARMMSEHAEVEEQLAALRRLTGGFTPPDDACRSWRALYDACRKLHDDLLEHMRLENEVLFPRFLK